MAGARCRYGHKKGASGKFCVHLPGRWRPCFHRYGGDSTRRRKEREHNNYIYKQRHIRNDGGADGPYNACGPGHDDIPIRANEETQGRPVNVAEMLATINGAYYVERTSSHDVPNIIKTKKAIKKAFQYQMEGRGFSLVEVLSTCPTNWGFRR